MEGIINNFRRGMHTQKPNHIIVYLDGVDNKEKASKLVGKGAVWKSPAGKEINGKVASAHGNKGALRAVFETGLPGQCLGKKVKIE